MTRQRFDRERGVWICRWCQGDVPKEYRRRSYCSEEHHDAAWLSFSGSYRRDKVYARDGGVCAECRCDTRRLERVHEELRRCARGSWGDKPLSTAATRLERVNRELRKRGFPVDRGYYHKGTFWEADHVVPQVLGGKHELQNLRTLCVPCHKRATRELAGYRARGRKGTGRVVRSGAVRAARKGNCAMTMETGTIGQPPGCEHCGQHVDVVLPVDDVARCQACGKDISRRWMITFLECVLWLKKASKEYER